MTTAKEMKGAFKSALKKVRCDQCNVTLIANDQPFHCFVSEEAYYPPSTERGGVWVYLTDGTVTNEKPSGKWRTWRIVNFYGQSAWILGGTFVVLIHETNTGKRVMPTVTRMWVREEPSSALIRTLLSLADQSCSDPLYFRARKDLAAALAWIDSRYEIMRGSIDGWIKVRERVGLDRRWWLVNIEDKEVRQWRPQFDTLLRIHGSELIEALLFSS